MENSNPKPQPWEPGRAKRLHSVAQQAAMLVDQAKRQGFRLNTNDALESFRASDSFYKLARDFYFLKYGQEPPTHTQQWMENENDLPLSAHWRAEQQKKSRSRA